MYVELTFEYIDWTVEHEGEHIGLIFKRKDEPWVARSIRGTANPFEDPNEAVEWLILKAQQGG